MRKLATIREIAEIKPIPDADRIEVARIDGWEVVVSKKDNFHVGDRVVYVEIDSKMPETPEYEFLKSRKYVVKTIVMRGQVSQGLVMPLSVLPIGEYKLGQDVMGILGITKYDPQLEEENAIFEENRKKTRNPVVKFLMRYAWFRKLYLKKNTHTFNAHCKNTVFEYPCGRNKLHPTEKNHELLRELIRDNSNEGDIVFDPCCGSGAHCLVAKEENRNYIGVELKNQYYEIAKERLQ